eukprot:CAMPEP_0184743870 /NCGR_PEP_ID=MMETSP0315-20130426/6659_1 /TAXON_ID=101924 /ORGANISM="Rhodosorus marinus, Strain UTEX LB 2760" /LENGTH=139 /DNA_ID=CAMNT_0027215307 /DNA_START=79 /DNA_END=498 /DNA_ORIENTATION=+
MAVPLKKQGKTRETLIVVALAGVLLLMLIKYQLNSSRARFIASDLQLLRMESVGHEESIKTLRSQWWSAHRELEKLQKGEKNKAKPRAQTPKSAEEKTQENNEAAQAQAKANADAAAQPEGAADKPAEVASDQSPRDAA